MLLKGGSWSKKIEVAKAMKGDEISVHLISSEYGKPWKHIYIVTKKRKTATSHLVPIFCIFLNDCVLWCIDSYTGLNICKERIYHAFLLL